MSEEKRNDAASKTGADKDKSAASASKPNKTTDTSSAPVSSGSGKASAPATDTGSAKATDKNAAASGGSKPKTGAKKPASGSSKAATQPAAKPSDKASSKPTSKPSEQAASTPAAKPADKPDASKAGKPSAATSREATTAAASSASSASTTTPGSASRSASGGSAGTPHRPAPTRADDGGNGGGASKIIAIVAVVIAVVALIISGWLFARGQNRLASVDSRLSTVENGMQSNVQDVVMPRLKRLDSRMQSISGDVEQQAQALSSLQESMQQTQTQLADVADKAEGSNNRWDLNQIESLLQAANQRLQLYDDPKGARQALELASDTIRRKNDPRLFDLRGEIVNEIAALDALPNPDVEGMSLALTAMVERVPELPLSSSVPGDFQAQDESSSAQGGGDDSGMTMDEFQAQFSQGWDHFKDSVGEALSGMLTIRRSDGTQRALLPPEQAFFLNQNLQLELRTARLALLERDTQTYRDSLANARKWLEDYYDTGAAPVSNMRERLGQMSNVKLDWDAPDITASLVNLREKMAQRTGDQNGGSDNPSNGGDSSGGQNTNAGEAAAQDGQ